MRPDRNYVASIAGFDPSAGAGILADIKTFEQLGVYGFGVCSAITLQTEDEFKGVVWVPLHQIEAQLDTLLNKYEVGHVKLGLIQSLEVLDELIRIVKRKYSYLKIIWDPVLRASAGFQFHSAIDETLLHEILSQVHLVTPNIAEAKILMHSMDSLQAAKALHRFCPVFLKSYEDPAHQHYDVLFENGNESYFKTERLHGYAKHGSGCVLSAAITASLAKGLDLKSACAEAKRYTYEFLKSTEHLLGDHQSIKLISQHA